MEDTENSIEKKIYISKDGPIPISEMSNEHLEKAYKSKLKASFDLYIRSLSLTTVTDMLIEEIEKRGLTENLKNYSKNIVLKKSDLASLKEEIINQAIK